MSAIRKTLAAAASLARRFRGDDEGVAGIEMAIIAPVLVLMFCGGAEVCYYARSHFQTAQMASTVADAVSRYESITSTDIANIFSISSTVMGTDDFAKSGYVVLTSVSRTSGATPTVAWQCKGGALTSVSRIGEVSKTATLPGSLVLDATDNAIVAEVFYQHTPIFKDAVALEKLIYKTAVFRPRLGSLTTAPGC